MLKNKAECGCYSQSQKYQRASGGPLSFNYGFRNELISVSQFLPLTSDYVGGNSTITAGQIARANQTLPNKATLRKMGGFAPVSQKSRIPRRGWGSPSANNALISFQGQRVLGIYSSYCAPVESGKSENVVNYDFGFGDFDAWIPKQQPGEETKPNVDPDFGQQNSNGLGRKRDSAKGRKGHGQNSHDFSGAGPKSLGIHTISFTQSAAKVGALL